MPENTKTLDHEAEALRLLDFMSARGRELKREREPEHALFAALVHSNLAIAEEIKELRGEVQLRGEAISGALAEGQERVAEELKRLVEGVAFGLRDELQQALSEIVVAVKEGQS